FFSSRTNRISKPLLYNFGASVLTSLLVYPIGMTAPSSSNIFFTFFTYLFIFLCISTIILFVLSSSVFVLMYFIICICIILSLYFFIHLFFIRFYLLYNTLKKSGIRNINRE